MGLPLGNPLETSMEKSLNEIAKFLNVNRDELVLNLDKKTLDKTVEAWDNDDVIAVHHVGYKLKGW
jgi:hypothetical protein